MPFVGHQAFQFQTRRPGYLAGKVESRLPGSHAAAPHTDVHLDQNAQLDSFGRAGLGELLHIFRIIHRHHQVTPLRQVSGAVDLDTTWHLVGHQDIPDPGVRHDLRLADLGTGDANGTGLQLAKRDLGTFVSLAVRPDRCRLVGEKGRHPGYIPLKGGEVQQQGRRVEFLNRRSYLFSANISHFFTSLPPSRPQPGRCARNACPASLPRYSPLSTTT